MIDFYALTSPNVQKIFIMLEECGLPYNIKPVDVWAGEQFTPEFAKINPLLKVPAIVDSDGPGGKPYTVIEFGAILIYLAEKTGKFIPHEPVARYDTLQWLILQVANVGPMSGQHVHFSKFAGPGHDYSARRYRTQVIKLFDLYEAAARDASLCGRQRIYDRRHRGLAVAAQFRAACHRPRQISDDQGLGRQDRRARRRQTRARASAHAQIGSRQGHRRPEGPLLRPRKIRAGMITQACLALDMILPVLVFGNRMF